MRWFGDMYDAPFWIDYPRVETPIDDVCVMSMTQDSEDCDSVIWSDDSGFIFTDQEGRKRVYHRACFMRALGFGNKAIGRLAGQRVKGFMP